MGGGCFISILERQFIDDRGKGLENEWGLFLQHTHITPSLMFIADNFQLNFYKLLKFFELPNTITTESANVLENALR